jgi:predicted nucleic acid-binding protein
MPLDIPDGERFFVDSNILYYCFVETAPHSEMCRELLHRVQTGNLIAFTNIRSLQDCAHKTMLAEISNRSGRSRAGIVGWLKQQPESLAELPKTAEIGGRLMHLKLNLISTELADLANAIVVAQAHQLLLGDATIVVEMQRLGLVHLATNDDDFDRVLGINVWKPRP